MRYAALLPAHPVASSVTEYAATFGQDFYRVYRQMKYVEVLVAVFCIHDRQRVERLHQESARLDSAALTAFAFHDTEQLNRERSKYERRLEVGFMERGDTQPASLRDALRTIREAQERASQE